MKFTYKRFEPLPSYSGLFRRIRDRQRYERQNFRKGCLSSIRSYRATNFLDRVPLLLWLYGDGQKPRFALRQKIL